MKTLKEEIENSILLLGNKSHSIEEIYTKMIECGYKSDCSTAKNSISCTLRSMVISGVAERVKRGYFKLIDKVFVNNKNKNEELEKKERERKRKLEELIEKKRRERKIEEEKMEEEKQKYERISEEMIKGIEKLIEKKRIEEEKQEDERIRKEIKKRIELKKEEFEIEEIIIVKELDKKTFKKNEELMLKRCPYTNREIKEKESICQLSCGHLFSKECEKYILDGTIRYCPICGIKNQKLENGNFKRIEIPINKKSLKILLNKNKKIEEIKID